MKAGLHYRSELGDTPHLVPELDNIVATVRGGYHVEHNEDDTHGDVHADSIATDVITGRTSNRILVKRQTDGEEAIRVGPTGYVLLRGGTQQLIPAGIDPGCVLDIRGDGITAATKALQVTNAAGLIGLLVYNDGKVELGQGGITVNSVLQNELTQVAYNGANFTASAGVWTVQAGDQFAFGWSISGKLMTVIFELAGTDLSLAAATLSIAIPGGYTSSLSQQTRNPCYVQNAGAPEIGFAYVGPSANVIQVFRTSGANFAAGVGTIAALGQISFYVA